MRVRRSGEQFVSIFVSIFDRCASGVVMIWSILNRDDAINDALVYQYIDILIYSISHTGF